MEEEIGRLKLLLQEKETIIYNLENKLQSVQTNSESLPGIQGPEKVTDQVEDISDLVDVKDHLKSESLSNADIARYSRQLILPEIAVTGQIKLKNSSVLIVGCGGLGCPAAIYLAAAGVGRLGLVDYDEVELNNLHRQILHTEQRVNVRKSQSAATACKQLNSSVDCVPYHVALNSQNALHIIKQYDIVLDATDNVATRYLLNDACVLAGKPLVSGSALRFEGQLTVYNHDNGPCYRCLFPKPPPPETVTNCSDGGVLGVVPGIIGCIQALEAIKIAVGITTTFSGRLLLFDGLAASFCVIRLRGHQPNCVVCGKEPTITKLIDYEQFCGTRATDKSKEFGILGAECRVSVQEYSEIQSSGQPHVLVDVRLPVEQQICQLKNSINLPVDQIDKKECVDKLRGILQQQQHKQVYVVCRRGNDSQLAVNKLKESLSDINVQVKDIRGGLTAWAKHIDTSFPVY